MSKKNKTEKKKAIAQMFKEEITRADKFLNQMFKDTIARATASANTLANSNDFGVAKIFNECAARGREMYKQLREVECTSVIDTFAQGMVKADEIIKARKKEEQERKAREKAANKGNRIRSRNDEAIFKKCIDEIISNVKNGMTVAQAADKAATNSNFVYSAIYLRTYCSKNGISAKELQK